MSGYIHIGGKIEDLLEEQHKTKRELASDIDMSASNVVYLCGKESMDVQMLHKIGNALKYNFFKHFPIDEGKPKADAISNERAKVIEEKQNEIERLKSQFYAESIFNFGRINFARSFFFRPRFRLRT